MTQGVIQTYGRGHAAGQVLTCLLVLFDNAAHASLLSQAVPSVKDKGNSSTQGKCMATRVIR